MEGEQPGVTATAPVAQPTAASDVQPQANQPVEQSAGDGVKAPETQEDKQVPYDRFREVNDKAKSSAEEAAKWKAKAEELEANRATTPNPTDDKPVFDQETDKSLEEWARRQGFVTPQELAAERVHQQAERDVDELKSEFKDFDKDKVLDYAQENGLSVTSKAGLKKVYQAMKGEDTSVQDEIRNQLIAELKENGQLKDSYAEKPGAGGARLTPTEEPRGLKARISASVAKHRS